MQLDRLDPKQDARRAPVIARALFRHLCEQGYSREQIIAVSAELLGLLSTEIKTSEQLEAAE